MFATESVRKQGSAQRAAVFGKSYRLVQVVESNDMYDRLVRCYYSASTISHCFNIACAS